MEYSNKLKVIGLSVGCLLIGYMAGMLRARDAQQQEVPAAQQPQTAPPGAALDDAMQLKAVTLEHLSRADDALTMQGQPSGRNDLGGEDVVPLSALNQRLVQDVMSGAVLIPEPPPTMQMTVDGATQYIRSREVVDLIWAADKQQDLSMSIVEPLLEFNAAATNVECRKKSCMIEWYSAEPIWSDPEAAHEFMLQMSSVTAPGSFTVDPDNQNRGLYIIEYDR